MDNGAPDEDLADATWLLVRGNQHDEGITGRCGKALSNDARLPVAM